MAVERTLGLIKPDAVGDNNVGKIISRFEREGLRLCACRMIKLSKEKAEGFYIEHKDQSYFGPLVSFMTSSPVVAMVLEGDNAIYKCREIMGENNPEDAAEGTLRKDLARSIIENAVHGSSSLGKAEREIAYFFEKEEIQSRFNS